MSTVMEIRDRFAQRLRTRREELGLTQADLAKLAGMHQPDLCDLEKGRHAPTLETLERLAIPLKVDPSYLVSEAK